MFVEIKHKIFHLSPASGQRIFSDRILFHSVNKLKVKAQKTKFIDFITWVLHCEDISKVMISDDDGRVA